MGLPIRQVFGNLVKSKGTVEVHKEALPNAQPDVWLAAGSPGYGRAWPNISADIPNEQASGRSMVLRTDRDLQLGPPPGRIRRINQTRIGAMGGAGIPSGFPYTADMGYIQHLKVGKLLTGTSEPARTIADDAWVAAVYAGNPVK